MLPQEFVDSLPCQLSGLPAALESEPSPVSVRVNLTKGIEIPSGAARVPWAADCGFYLEERPRFTFDPSLHQGLYYAQDASSMVIAEVIRRIAPQCPLRYLDACAAPGGKTTAAIDALPSDSFVVANEYCRDRVASLVENVSKWGVPGVMVSQGDTSAFRRLPGFFDIIAADVPCSGEGMMRKDMEAVEQWSPGLVEECATRQREILDNLWVALRPGGFLIYSTCTFNRLENELMLGYIHDALGGEPVDTGIAALCPEIMGPIDSSFPAMRFIPGRTRGEGLFMAVMRKPGEPTTAAPRRTRASGVPAALQPLISLVKSWIKDSGNYDFAVRDNRIFAFPSTSIDSSRRASEVLDIVMPGVEVAQIKGRDLIPSQSLAVSTALDREAFPECEVDYHSAIAYLRREAIILADDAPKGYVLLTYGGYPLGFVKNLGKRANNVYPHNWRILSSHIPESPPSVIGR